jgi:EAL domain-containing protein (putative c-di-GMP-specific phosphodiesterase class I)
MSLARSLQLAVVAEGVETAAQIELLSALECDTGQGFFFSRPLPALQIAGLLSGGALPLTDASARGRRDHVAG